MIKPFQVWVRTFWTIFGWNIYPQVHYQAHFPDDWSFMSWIFLTYLQCKQVMLKGVPSILITLSLFLIKIVLLSTRPKSHGQPLWSLDIWPHPTQGPGQISKCYQTPNAGTNGWALAWFADFCNNQNQFLFLKIL